MVRVLCIPLIVTAVVRVLGATLLCSLFNVKGVVQTPWMQQYGWNSISASTNWLWLFNAWDSFNFGFIVTQGYHEPNYTYLPGYPLLIHLVTLITGNVWLAAFIATQIFAAASIIMFQLTAEIYLPRREALYSTLIMATFPYVFIFTALSYSEPVFFFSTIAAWYFYKKRKLSLSTILVGLATLTRIYGILILLPVFLSMKKARKVNAYYFITPVVALAAWGFYCLITVGNVLASLAEEGTWVQTGINYGLVPSIVYQGLRGIVMCCTGPPNNNFDPALLIAVALLPFLIVRISNIDRSLLAYSATLFGMLILTAPVMSLLRYDSFVFPIWLTVGVKNSWAVILCMALFVPLSLVLWYYALTRYFIG